MPGPQFKRERRQANFPAWLQIWAGQERQPQAIPATYQISVVSHGGLRPHIPAAKTGLMA